jgi:hypothetical protein
MTALLCCGEKWEVRDVPLEWDGKPFYELIFEKWDAATKSWIGRVFHRRPLRDRLEYEYHHTEIYQDPRVVGLQDIAVGDEACLM